jgi:CspA family cold shock protein
MEGRVLFFDDHKSYGFIEAEGMEFFFHRSEIKTRNSYGARSLGTGDRVEFQSEKNKKGLKATNIKKIEEDQNNGNQGRDRAN